MLRRIPIHLQHQRLRFEVPDALASAALWLTVDRQYEALIVARDTVSQLGFFWPFVGTDDEPCCDFPQPGELDYEAAIPDEIY